MCAPDAAATQIARVAAASADSRVGQNVLAVALDLKTAA